MAIRKCALYCLQTTRYNESMRRLADLELGSYEGVQLWALIPLIGMQDCETAAIFLTAGWKYRRNLIGQKAMWCGG